MPSQPNSSNPDTCDQFLEFHIFFSWFLGSISCLLGYFTTKWWCEAAEKLEMKEWSLQNLRINDPQYNPFIHRGM